MTVVNNNDSNDNVSHHQHHSNIVEEMNNTTATTATTSNTTTAAAATSTTSTSLLSSSSPTDHHNGETNNIIEYLQGIVNHDYNNNLTDTPIPFLQVISGEVATIVKRLQQGHIIPQSQQQKTQQGRHNNKQHTEQQHNNNSNETIMTEGVSSSLLSADPMIAYWYLKAATKLINITISYVSTNGDNNNNMMMSNNAGGGLLVDKNKNNSNNSRNPFSTKLNIKDNNNHYNKTDHFAPLQEVLEAIGSCVTFCQPRSLITESGIIHELQSLLSLTGLRTITSTNEIVTMIQCPDLSVVYVEFLQVCIYAEQYSYANMILHHVWPIPRNKDMISVKDVLRYYYLRGFIHTACGEINLAIRCYETCLTIPADCISAIAISAWKKYILLQCLVHTFDVTSSYGITTTKHENQTDQDMISSGKTASSSINIDDDGSHNRSSPMIVGTAFGMGLLSDHQDGSTKENKQKQRKTGSSSSSLLSFIDTISYPKEMPKCLHTFFEEAFIQQQGTTTSSTAAAVAAAMNTTTTTGANLKRDNIIDVETSTMMHIVESNNNNNNADPMMDIVSSGIHEGDDHHHHDKKQPQHHVQQHQSLPKLGVKVYYDLMYSFIAIDRIQFHTIFRDDDVTRSQLIIDGNYGLVQRCYDALILRHIVALSTVFSSISIRTLQLQLHLQSMDDVVLILHQLTTNYKWDIKIDLDNNYVSFPRYPSSMMMMSSFSMKTKYSNSSTSNNNQDEKMIVQELVELTKLMQQYDVDVASSSNYCNAVMKDINHNNNKRTDNLKKHGPRGVEDLSYSSV